MIWSRSIVLAAWQTAMYAERQKFSSCMPERLTDRPTTVILIGGMWVVNPHLRAIAVPRPVAGRGADNKAEKIVHKLHILIKNEW